MQYLCNQYAPDNSLYPKDPKKRAIVDRWLNFDLSLYSSHKNTFVINKLDHFDIFQLINYLFVQFLQMVEGVAQTHDKVIAFKNDFNFLDQLIGDNKYLTGEEVTIADFAVLATIELFCLGHFSEYQNIIRWSESLKSELPYYKEINDLEKEYTFPLIEDLKAYIKNAQNNQ